MHQGNFFNPVADPNLVPPNGTAYDDTRIISSDRNLLYSPTGSANFHFPYFHDFASWKNVSGHDSKSAVSDPLFVDAVSGNYSLKEGSPAFALGFKQLPKISAPTVR